MDKKVYRKPKIEKYGSIRNITNEDPKGSTNWDGSQPIYSQSL